MESERHVRLFRNGRNQALRIEWPVVAHLRCTGQTIHLRMVDSGHGEECVADMVGARRAGHAFDIGLNHCFLPFLSSVQQAFA